MSNRMLVNLKNISLTGLTGTLFQGLSLTVNRGEIMALIGGNGCGKSTLLQLIKATSNGPVPRSIHDFDLQGEIYLTPGTRTGLLPQLIGDDDNFIGLLDNVGLESSAEYLKINSELGLESVSQAVLTLSDGQLQKRSLAYILSRPYDLYLLDEPTNYLDLTGLTVFEEYLLQLKERGKSIILVTHDRALADAVADQTCYISTSGIYQVGGGASDAIGAHRHDIDSRKRKSQQIRNKIAQLQADMRQKFGWSDISEKRKKGAKRARAYYGMKSKKMAKRAVIARKRSEQEQKRLEEIKPFIPKQVDLQFPSLEIKRRRVFSLEEISFRYGAKNDRYLLKNITIAADTSDKICLMGSNGTGKTTLLRLILGDLDPVRGKRLINDGVKTAYIPQGLKGFFNRTVLLDNFRDCPYTETEIRKYLGAVLLRQDKVIQPLGSFSYGELMRAAVVRCILEQAEFLFWDEPTSHLDIESITVLENILKEYRGGFVIISHDRTFVENTAENLYLLEHNSVKIL